MDPLLRPGCSRLAASLATSLPTYSGDPGNGGSSSAAMDLGPLDNPRGGTRHPSPETPSDGTSYAEGHCNREIRGKIYPPRPQNSQVQALQTGRCGQAAVWGNDWWDERRQSLGETSGGKQKRNHTLYGKDSGKESSKTCSLNPALTQQRMIKCEATSLAEWKHAKV